MKSECPLRMSIRCNSKISILNKQETLQKPKKDGAEGTVSDPTKECVGFVCAGVKTPCQRNKIKQCFILLQ